MVLMAKDLWSIVDGSEVKSSGDAAATEWEKKNQKALAYISLLLTPIEQHHILDCTTAKAAWDILKKLYEGKGRNCKFLLMEQLFKLNMDAHGTTMDSYLRMMKDKLSELAAIGITLDKEVKLALIFNGITERFRYLIVALEQQDLNFDELTARLIEEAERYPGTPKSGTAYTVRRGQTVPLKCFYCG